MRPCFVIILSPILNDRSRLFQRYEPVLIQAFITELAVEAFYHRVLGRLAGLDKRQLHARPLRPYRHRLARAFRTVVQNDLLRITEDFSKFVEVTFPLNMNNLKVESIK